MPFEKDDCGCRGEKELQSRDWKTSRQRPDSKCSASCITYGLYGNCSAVPLWWGNSPRWYIHEWMWHCSSKTLLTKKQVASQIWPKGHGLLISAVGIKSPGRVTSWEVTGLIQRRGDGGLDQGSANRSPEKQVDVDMLCPGNSVCHR